MTSSAFWFCISAMYFPYISNEIVDKSAGIPETLQKILEKYINAPKIIYSKNKIRRKKILIDLISLINTNYIKRNEEQNCSYIEQNIPKKQISIDSLINEVSEKLSSLEEIKQETISRGLIESIKKTNMVQLEENTNSQVSNNSNSLLIYDKLKILTDNQTDYFSYKDYDPNDILIDMQFKSKFKKEFEEYIIKKHEKISENQNEIILSRSDEEKNHNPDDIVCLVCNDGDYEDNNLIVYCSKCQMTVHQLCYGIINIPEEDWLCYPCQFYNDEKAKEIECVLCPIQGGAMKPSYLKLKSGFWNYIMSLRRENYMNDYFPNEILNNYTGSNSAPTLLKTESSEKMIKYAESSFNKEELKLKPSEIICEHKHQEEIDTIYTPKRNLSFQKLDFNNQESYRKNISNLTITDFNEDEFSLKYFDQNQINENNFKNNKNDEACKNKAEEENKMIKNKEFIYRDSNINNENMHSTLIDENMECPNSINDFNTTIIRNRNKSKKDDFIKNIDDESDYSKELFEKTNAEILSNDLLNYKNNKSNIDYNLNLNENDNLSNHKCNNI